MSFKGLLYLVVSGLLLACSPKGDNDLQGVSAVPEADSDDQNIQLEYGFVKLSQSSDSIADQALAVHIKLHNHTSKSLKLIYVSSPIADHIQLYRKQYIDGKKRYIEYNHRLLKSKGVIKFGGGDWKMLMKGVYEPINALKMIPLELEFDHGIRMPINLEVQK